MPTFDAVNYSLRPSKSIQRQLVFDAVRLLQAQLDLERLVYIGFGSIWFVDFTLAHKLLLIDDMVSIESDQIGFRRGTFNAPYATVRVEEGFSGQVLPKLFDDPTISGRPWMVWLDFDYELGESVRDDLRSIIEKAPMNSVLLATFNGLDRKYGNANVLPARLREILGSVVPDDLDKEQCKGDNMQSTLADLVLNYMKSCALDIARPGGFVPAFRLLYRDGAPMVTVGGILPAKGAATVAWQTVNSPLWPGQPAAPIQAPHLTIRESASLQRLLPTNTPLTRASVQELGFDLQDEQLRAFELYYRQYPAFAQIIT